MFSYTCCGQHFVCVDHSTKNLHQPVISSKSRVRSTGHLLNDLNDELRILQKRTQRKKSQNNHLQEWNEFPAFCNYFKRKITPQKLRFYFGVCFLVFPKTGVFKKLQTTFTYILTLLGLLCYKFLD